MITPHNHIMSHAITVIRWTLNSVTSGDVAVNFAGYFNKVIWLLMLYPYSSVLIYVTAV